MRFHFGVGEQGTVAGKPSFFHRISCVKEVVAGCGVPYSKDLGQCLLLCCCQVLCVVALICWYLMVAKEAAGLFFMD